MDAKRVYANKICLNREGQKSWINKINILNDIDKLQRQNGSNTVKLKRKKKDYFVCQNTTYKNVNNLRVVFFFNFCDFSNLVELWE